VIESFYLQSGQAQKEEPKNHLMENCPQVYQPHGKMLQFVKPVAERTNARIPKIR
jgi:hypothetical protein